MFNVALINDQQFAWHFQYLDANNVTTALNFRPGTVSPATGAITDENAVLVTNPGRRTTNYQYSATASQAASFASRWSGPNG